MTNFHETINKLSSLQLSPEQKEKIINTYVGLGADRASAQEVLDLATHAHNEAMRAVANVIMRAKSPNITLTIFPLSLQMIIYTAAATLEASVEAAKNAGTPIQHISIVARLSNE